MNTILAIAYRDFLKFLRDRARILFTFIFPFVFVGILGSSLQSNLGAQAGYNLLLFTFIGVIGQTLFQSTASGIISLVEDRENDFSQEMFISPVSRYSIIVGKILGESMVAFTQTVGIIVFGIIVRIPISLPDLIKILPVSLLVCLYGGAFGVIILSQLKSQRAANQVFPFVIFPQFFLAGVFNPIKNLPPYLFVMSRLSPMTYAVDFIRSIYYAGKPEYSKIVLNSPAINLGIMLVLSLVFITVGTFLFVRNEKNR